MRVFAFLILFFQVSFGFSQEKITYANYSWDETFDREKYDASAFSDNEATILLDRKILVYNPNMALTRGKRIHHQIVWIDKESSIDKMNKLYLYANESVSVKEVMVRVVSEDGAVIALDESKMEDVSLKDGNANFKIIAIPGIKVKSWVEIYIDYDGISYQNRLLHQEPFHTVRAEVIFQVTKHREGPGYPRIRPVLRGYNGFYPQIKSLKNIDSEIAKPKKKQKYKEDYYSFSAESISPWLGDENYSQEYQFCPRVDITLSPYQWMNISNNLYASLNFDSPLHFSNKILRELGVDGDTEIEKLRRIENFIKQKITLTESNSRKYSYVSQIYTDRIANESGIIKFFIALLDDSDIDFELYYVASKDYIEPDEYMPMTIGFEDFLFYFPKSKKYIVPMDNYYRVGKIPNYLGGRKRIELINVEKPKKSSYIGTLEYSVKEDNVGRSETKISLDLEFSMFSAMKKLIYFGDAAIQSRGAMNYMDEAEKNGYVQDALVNGMKDVELFSVQIVNDDIYHNSIEEDSLIISGVIESKDLLVSIGSDYLISLTQVIGVQSSFYNESERVHKIYIENSKISEHIIEFEIPNGYILEGIDELIYNREYVIAEKGQAKTVASFISTAEIVNNVLSVEVNEFYEEGFYPKEDIEEFQAVINAAYEFYNVKLKLTKK